MIVGLVALGRLPIAQYPEITPPMVSVTGTYTGANATDVEQSVACQFVPLLQGLADQAAEAERTEQERGVVQEDRDRA
mgnify:CR=1 FL=1